MLHGGPLRGRCRVRAERPADPRVDGGRVQHAGQAGSRPDRHDRLREASRSGGRMGRTAFRRVVPPHEEGVAVSVRERAMRQGGRVRRWTGEGWRRGIRADGSSGRHIGSRQYAPGRALRPVHDAPDDAGHAARHAHDGMVRDVRAECVRRAGCTSHGT